ncbi:DUF2207 domain-containing protein [Sinanaerobacter sp. ZZT-01]|uniref:DUF2207 domain-containing protein n=1 Tax=Sinanaerobacter sp. ZZT-01 TaxID=3111540 RepID=UPI002D7A144A|nr:DUF2207 domain-containing protein [Sinanaerobacter sp. ZZT-01]WRR92253.1 DUF2207 domain-containing protein [Sinanaerobacter sp. ZZT-01]
MKGLVKKIIVFFVGLIFMSLPFTVYGANFKTERYDVNLDVSENNSFYVEENISVDFTSPGHGIYRYIPVTKTWKYQLLDGETVEKAYKLKIKELETPGFENEISYENGYMLVRIGDPDLTVSGPVTYKLRYQVIGHEDGEVSFDQFYWNLLSQEWETPIENADFTIHMPKEFDSSSVEFISGTYGQNDTSIVVWDREGNTLKGSIQRELQKGEGSTIRIVLPEGYFSGERNNNWMAPAMYVLILLAAGMSFLLWWFFGRDPKIIKTVEFYPPQGVTPGEIGYILDGAVDDNDIISMILHFANEGYLEIKEEEKEQFQLIKKKELPDSTETYEHTLFQGLFEGRDTVRLDELKEDFYPVFQASKGQLKGKFTQKKGNLVYTKASVFAQIITTLILINPLLCVAILGVEYRYLSGINTLLFIPVIVLVLAGYGTMKSMYERKDNSKKGTKTGMSIASVLLIGIGLGGFFLLGNFLLDLPLASILAAVSTLICTVCAVAMKRRTQYSVQLMGKILGFKEFIRTAELDRIKRLAEDNPNYFYHVLPYAYVFGLSDIWAKKFESIAVAPPDWYHSGYNGNLFTTYVFLNSFHHYTNAMQSNIVIPSSGGTGTIGSGGFSSGGGFSGGGMGGGGGGSW